MRDTNGTVPTPMKSPMAGKPMQPVRMKAATVLNTVSTEGDNPLLSTTGGMAVTTTAPMT